VAAARAPGLPGFAAELEARRLEGAVVDDAGDLAQVRDVGLGLVDRIPPLKNAFIRQAAGLSGEVPRLLRGEAL